MTDSSINNTFKFKPSAINTGAVTIGYDKVTIIKKNGVPLKAGDIKQGEIITVNRLTGEIE